MPEDPMREYHRKVYKQKLAEYKAQQVGLFIGVFLRFLFFVVCLVALIVFIVKNV